MSERPPDIDAMIDAYLDGVADADTRDAVAAWILESDDNAERFLLRAAVHADTRDALRNSAERGTDRTRRLGLAPVALSLAAAVLVAAAAVGIYLYAVSLPTPEPPDPRPGAPVATLIDATDTVIYENDIARPGSEYASGQYSIESGSAEFLLTNRVGVTMRGATRLVVVGNMRASLERGEAEFHCPPEAAGYTVELPSGARIVDLGTAFTVRVDDDGEARVTVTDGSVELHGLNDGANVVETLTRGATASVDADGRPFDVRHRTAMTWTGAGNENFLNEANWEVLGEAPREGTLEKDRVIGYDVVIGPGAHIVFEHSVGVQLGDGGSMTVTDARVVGRINTHFTPVEVGSGGSATITLNGSTEFQFGWGWDIAWELNDESKMIAINTNASPKTGILGASSTLNFNSPRTSLTLPHPPEKVTTPEWIAKLRVGGEPAVLGVNLSATAIDDGAGTIFRPIPDGAAPAQPEPR